MMGTYTSRAKLNDTGKSKHWKSIYTVSPAITLCTAIYQSRTIAFVPVNLVNLLVDLNLETEVTVYHISLTALV